MAGEEVTRGRELKAARIKAGLDQTEASQRLGIHRVSLSRIERGEQKKVSADLYQKMMDLYDQLTERREPLVLREARSGYEPRVALGIPQRIRIVIQKFLLDLTEAGVAQEEVDATRRILESDELHRVNWGGERDYTEDEILEGIEGHITAYRQRFRRRGFKIAK